MARLPPYSKAEQYLKLITETEFNFTPEFMERELRVRIDITSVAEQLFRMLPENTVDIVKLRIGNELYVFQPEHNVTRKENFMALVGMRRIEREC